jgi:hypothetical protein
MGHWCHHTQSATQVSRNRLSSSLDSLSRTLQLGLAQGLDLADEHVLQGVNTLACLLNLLADALGLELLAHLHQVGARHLTLDDLDHLLADVLDLTRLGVRRLLGLVLTSLGESDGKATKLEAVSRGHVDVALLQRTNTTYVAAPTSEESQTSGTQSK